MLKKLQTLRKRNEHLYSVLFSVVCMAITIAAAAIYGGTAGRDPSNVTLLFIFSLIIISCNTIGYFYGLLCSLLAVLWLGLTQDVSPGSLFITFLGMAAVTIFISALISHSTTQSELIAEREKQLAEAGLEKTRANLLRAISHDLRTPLSGILGNCLIFLENQSLLSEQEKRQIVTNIQESSDWLINMVENLLSITRIREDRPIINTTDEIVEEVLLHRQRQDRLTEGLDAALTHRVWGIPIFLGIMALVFFLTFTVGDWIKGYFEHTIDALSLLAQQGMDAIGVAPIVQSLVVDGVIGGVGTIVTFLPNIFILFLALAFLEDSGYMARVAYVMEGVMSRLGLSGKAFIPMLLGFGCTVPALMASRALESRRDRYKVMLVTPFMSCNARLTIYILFSEMFFGEYAMLAAYSMYLIGIAVAMLVSVGLHLLDREKAVNYLLIELPEYKLPDARTVGIYVWDKVKDYLGKAGSTIFLATLLIWLLLNFGPQGYDPGMSGGFGAMAGRWLVPFFAPIGLGFWQIAVALIAGISAKEVVVSSCAVLFGIVNANSPAGMEAFAQVLSGIGFGPLNAFCLMVFCLLYVPCAATLATIKKESGSWGWTVFVAVFQVAVAWLVTFLAYRVGLMIL